MVSKDYEPKGKYVEFDGVKTCELFPNLKLLFLNTSADQTGPSDAKHAILIVYDIFGYFPQTIQGADILAYGDKEKPYQVFMPDFFEGKPADMSWYPPDNEEKGKKLGEFFKTQAAPPKIVPRVPKIVESIKQQHSGLQTWAVVGYCWGGKIVNLTSQEGTLFKAAATCHPAMTDPNDASKVTIPIAVLPSKDEDEKAVSEYERNLKVPHIVEWFKDQIHGWMAARYEFDIELSLPSRMLTIYSSNLEDENVKKEYERGYKTLLDFFHQHV